MLKFEKGSIDENVWQKYKQNNIHDTESSKDAKESDLTYIDDSQKIAPAPYH